jgi:hypothetical protein
MPSRAFSFPEAIVDFRTSGRRLKVLAQIVVVGLAVMQVSAADAAPQWRERRAFVAVLQGEMRQLDGVLKQESTQLKASQKARRDQSEREARDRRRECFKQSTRGSEKRACVQALLARRKVLVQQLKEETKRMREDHRQRRKQAQEDHRRRLAEFDRGGAAQPSALAAPMPTPSP